MNKWDCSCGAKNIKTKFCPECGAKKPDKVEIAKANSKKKWIIPVIAGVLVLVIAVVSVILFTSGKPNNQEEKAQLLSFAQATSLEEMEKLSGKTVSIIGYMSTLSPVSGKFMYLMNLPYQSCPFCIPNTTTLSNTLAIYAEEGKTFEFTDRAVQVIGTLEFGSWTDEFGYQYDYRIKDATFEILNTENMSEELKMWQTIAASNVVMDIYSMYEYTSFVCFWAEYTANFGNGYDYIYPDDVNSFITGNGSYAYANNDKFFDDIIKTLKEIDEVQMADLIQNVESCRALCKKALAELENKNYTMVPEYSKYFGDGRNQYRLNIFEELNTEFNTNYEVFANWIAKWEV
jgi:hypothetical protein